MATNYTAQMMLLLAYAADTGDTQPYTKDCATATSMYGDIQKSLAELNRSTGSAWEVVWGPAIFSFPVNVEGRHIDNVIYVARNGASNDYVIAVAGTDPYSLDDWIFEDFLVGTTVPWYLEFGFTPRPRISLATFNGLTILLNISPPCVPLPGTGQTLMTFLGTITSGQVNIYTTGHSLGGALAPSLTLALHDLRYGWDSAGNATFHPFAFAGPTPGDEAFAAYFNKQFPQGLQRIWNAIDIVPHAWDTAHMEKLPTLYGTSIAEVADAVKAIVPRIEPIGYTPLNNMRATFTGPRQNPNITTFEQYMKEAAWQHTTAYADWAQRTQETETSEAGTTTSQPSL